MKVLGSKLLVVERICNKYLKEKNGKVAYLFARNKTIVSGPLEDMRGVTKPTQAMEEFANARAKLAEEFAERDNDGKPKQELDRNTGRMRYVISRFGALNEAAEKLLEEKFPQAKADQEAIDKRANEILEEHVDVDFFRMELGKIPGFRNENDEDNGIIEAGDLAVLLELGIVYDKEEEKDNVTEIKKKKE